MRPRPSGGFNTGMGSFGEHIDENAMQQASQQKATTQQAADPAVAQAAAAAQKQHQTGQVQPREVSSFSDELIKRPLSDIFTELKTFFSINNWLGIEAAKKDAKDIARQKQMVKRYNQLNQEQQAVARKNYEVALQKKQQEEQEKEMKRQQLEQQKAQSVVVPSSPQKGPQGPGGNKKQKAVTKLQNDRKTLSGPSSAN